MSSSTSTPARTGSTLDPIREVVDSYGRSHDVDVWFWQRIAGEWVVAAGTSAPPLPAMHSPWKPRLSEMRSGVEPQV